MSIVNLNRACHQQHTNHSKHPNHCQRSRMSAPFAGRTVANKTQRNHMIRCTLVVILAILLLLIAVSGFFILLISNDCTIFYPYAQHRSQYMLSGGTPQSMSTPQQVNHNDHSTFFYFFFSLTICQLTLIIMEVLVALVIIFVKEMGCDYTTNSMSSPGAQYKPITVAASRAAALTKPYPATKCGLMCALKIAFFVLISLSLILRMVTSSFGSLLWADSDWQQLSPVYTTGDPDGGSMMATSMADTSHNIVQVSDGATYLSGLLYATTLFESLLFFLVLTSTSSTPVTAAASIPSHSSSVS